MSRSHDIGMNVSYQPVALIVFITTVFCLGVFG